LTSAGCYAVFYDTTPFLGGLAGCIGAIGVSKINELLSGIVLGTLATTFLVWIVVDPVTGFIETLLPAGRKYRLERLAQAKALRQEQEERRKHLLAEILAQYEQDRHRWRQILQPYAEELAQVLSGGDIDDKQAEDKAVSIGARAWQMGGINCMRQLYYMTMETCKKRSQNSMAADYVTNWWDGVGSWRNPSFG
jgi:hypothetical protein